MNLDFLDRWGGGRRRFLWISLGFALAVFLGVLDYLTGPDLSFLIFYFFPVFIGSWFGGRNAGYSITVLSSFAWLIDEVLSKPPHVHPSVPYWNVGVKLGSFFLFSFLLASLHDALRHQKELARTDDLTGIENRRSFLDAVSSELGRLRRYLHPFTVVYMDVDHLKEVNDVFGHSTGDGLLKAVAIAMLRSIRETDHAARLGGDEFALLLPETDQAGARVVIDRLKKTLDQSVNKKQWPVTFSMGVLTCYEPPDSVDTAIRKADQLMYAVKTSGKNNVKFGSFEGRGAK